LNNKTQHNFSFNAFYYSILTNKRWTIITLTSDDSRGLLFAHFYECLMQLRESSVKLPFCDIGNIGVNGETGIENRKR